MCKEIKEKWRVLVPVGAGMVLFSFFAAWNHVSCRTR